MERLRRSTLVRGLAAGFALAATASAVPSALHAAEDGPGLFDINLGLSLWTVVIFLALLGVLWKFAWGPILGAVASREARIQSSLDEAARRQAEAVRLLEEHKAQLADARRQVQEIIAEGRSAGERVRREIEEKSRAEAQKLLAQAQREILREKDAALEELRRETVELALAAAAKLVHHKMDPETDRELVLGYLRDLTRAAGKAGKAGEKVGT